MELQRGSLAKDISTPVNRDQAHSRSTMSGLEVLGAAASAIGVLSAVKTCVDLLEILSTARTAQRDLEDLLVFLQWERVRFFCFVVESGFAHAIDTGAWNGSRQTHPVSDHQMLLMLPREFRLPFFLGHLKRTIDNMNSRLQAAEQIIQRYCTTNETRGPPLNGRSSTWTQKLAGFVNPRSLTEPMTSLTPPSPRGLSPWATAPAASPAAAVEGRKLAFRDKVRWVSGDLKKLKDLLDTLRQYNTQLANVLPPSQSRSLCRRLERELTTSPGLSSQLAILDIGGNDLADDLPELRRARRYEILRYLLEQHDDESEVGTRATQRDKKRGTGRPPSSSLASVTSASSLRLRLADTSFDSPPASKREVRKFVSYEHAPAIVEWRYYPRGISAQERAYIDGRVHSLSMQLCQLSAVSDAGILHCLGYVHDGTNSRYGSLFAYPRDCDASSQPESLRERLGRDHEKRVRCELGERFNLARTLVLAVYRLLSVNWLHKDLSSENVLLFNGARDETTNGGGGGACQLFVCGFARSRRDAQFELSEKAATALSGSTRPSDDDERLYWHPDRTALCEAFANGARPNPTVKSPSALLTASYRREFDVYSLGILLLEIGFWCPIQRIAQEFEAQDAAAIASELRRRFVPELEGRMGKTYADVVAYCLGESCAGVASTAAAGESGDEYLLQTKLFLEQFEEQAVAKIERPYLGMDGITSSVKEF